MSRSERQLEFFEYRFPRVSGDEPRGSGTKTWYQVFSPRERG